MTGKINWISKALVLSAVMAGLSGGLQSAAQAGDWTWVDGSSTIGTTCYSSTYPCGQLGVYGTKGNLSAANLPGSRTDAMSWTDTTGRKWLFGGFGYGVQAGALGEMNDLWQSNATGTSWEWVSGSNGPGHGGVYGTQGTAAAANVPGGRQDAVTWTDNAGNLWLFGGLGYDGSGTTTGYGYLNDLWMYNPTTNQWTWENGSSTVPPYTTNSQLGTITYGSSAGVYGTMGTAAAGNTPGGRTNANAWTDASGNLWMFGGGYSNFNGISNDDSLYNDLWEFNTTTKQWTWQGGSNTSNGSGTYGTLGTASSSNIPGARYQGGSWKDLSGNFWLFGGLGYDANGGAAGLDDLWKFNISTKQWTWESGAQTVGVCGNFLFGFYACEQTGSYGTQGTAGGANVPGGRVLFVTWTDTSGNLWLFGGSGADSVNNEGWLNDFWKFNPSTPNSVTSTNGEWTWVAGTSTRPTCAAGVAGGSCGAPGVYGTEGTAASANIPGARQSAVSWTDLSGNFWLFGGWGEDSASAIGYLNDMWEYQPSGGSSTPTAATPTFSIAAGNYSSAQSVTLSDTTSGSTIYYTTNGNTPTTSSSVYITSPNTPINVSSSETINAIAVASGYSNSAVGTAAYTITAATPTISIAPGSVVFSNQTVNTTSGTTTLLVTNTSTATINFSGFTFTGTNPSAFAQVTAASSPCGATLAGNATCNLAVTFTPTAATSYSALFNVADNATGSPQQIALSGTGTSTPVAQPGLSPTSFTFPNTQVNATSGSQSFTLSNTGSATLTGIAISIIGANPSDFAETSTCGTTLSAPGNCSILVTFTPASATTFNGTLSVANSVATQTATLTGTGTAAQASLTPTTLTFASTTVNTTTAAQTITLSNPGNATLTNIGVSLTGANPTDFAETTTCGSTLAALGSCTISVTFTPLSATTFGANVTVATSAGAQTTALTGTGTAAATAQAVLSPTTFTFPSTTVATTSAAQTFTLSNPGTATLTGIAVSLGGTNSADFAETTTCGSTLAAAGSCNISVTFTPASAATFTGSLSVANSIATQTSALSGTGTAAAVAQAVLSPTTFTFSSTTVATTSAAQTFTLSNPGTATLTGIAVSLGGTNPADFAQTTTCGTTLAAAGSCTITVTFTPASATSFNGTLSVANSIAAQTASLSGTGTAAAVAQAVLSPTTFTFPSTTLGTTSTAQTFTLSNPGSATLTGIAVSLAGANPADFAETTTCGATLAAAGSCTVSVTFTPASAATFTGTLSVANSVATQTSALSGTGTAAAVAQAVLSPTTFTFASTTLGTTSTGQTFTLSNPGSATLTGIAVSLGGTNSADFAQTTTCGATLAATGSCTISVTFTPASAATFTGTLSVANSVATQTSSLSGTGTAVPVAQAVLTPTTYTFASTTVTTTSAAQNFTLSNPGTATLTGIAVSLTGANSTSFAETTTCGATLAAAGTCSISVTFSPAATQTYTANVSVANSIAAQTATLSGTGVAVGALNFSLVSPTSTVAVDPGGIANFTINVNPLIGSDTTPVVLSVTGLPPGATASFNPTSVTPGSTGASSVLSVQTSASFASNSPASKPFSLPVHAPMFAGLLLLPLAGVRRFRRKLRELPSATRLLALLLLSFATLLPLSMALSGCSGGYFGAAAQSYHLTVTGTSGAVSSSTTVTLTIQ